jgi:mannose-6-phosphate isomerase
MANSDNVLRCGLTSKHIDVEELLAVVDTTPGNASTITNAVDGLYPAPVSEFALLHLGASGERRLITVHGPAILLCTAGEVEVDGVVHSVGSSFFVRSDESVAIRARGTSWLARVASDT